MPQSFIEEMRRPIVRDPNGDGKPVSAMSLSPELREELITKLKVALSDSEECAVSYANPLANPRSAPTYCQSPRRESLTAVIRVVSPVSRLG